MGHSVLEDPWVLKLAGISKKIWRIQDYASDLLLVPRLASGVTLKKINFVENMGLGSKAVLSSTALYFTQLY
jgi:hypothetical protein